MTHLLSVFLRSTSWFICLSLSVYILFSTIQVCCFFSSFSPVIDHTSHLSSQTSPWQPDPLFGAEVFRRAVQLRDPVSWPFDLEHSKYTWCWTESSGNMFHPWSVFFLHTQWRPEAGGSWWRSKAKKNTKNIENIPKARWILLIWSMQVDDLTLFFNRSKLNVWFTYLLTW